MAIQFSEASCGARFCGLRGFNWRVVIGFPKFSTHGAEMLYVPQQD